MPSDGIAKPMKDTSKTDVMLLGMLMSRPMHGYEVVDELSGPYMSIWVKLSRASVYYALARLAKSKFVSHHSERQTGKPDKTVYSITDEGRRAFYSAVEVQLGSQPESMDDFDVALFFAGQLDRETAAARIATRARSLRQTGSLLDKSLDDARQRGEAPLVAVLERRRALVDTEIAFLSRLNEILAGGLEESLERSGGTETIEAGPLHEVLRNLSASGRSGILWAFADRRRIGFQFKDGTLTDLISVGKSPTEEALRKAFSASSSPYAFAPGATTKQRMVPVEGHAAVILGGCRLVSPSAIGQRLPAEPELVFDARHGYEYETVGLDLTADERRLLGEIDGVRTLRDLGRQLQWDMNTVLTTLFPLWATGWVVRSDMEKRLLVDAVARYLGLFSEAVVLLADSATINLIYGEVSFAAEESDLPDFWHPRDRRRVASRFPGDRHAVENQARAYIRLVLRSATARLGERLVSEIAGGIGERIDDKDGMLLEDLAVLRRPVYDILQGEQP